MKTKMETDEPFEIKCRVRLTGLGRQIFNL